MADRDRKSCWKPLLGWECSRGVGHEGPCAASLVRTESDDTEIVECPACGEYMSMTDASIEGVLTRGYEQECYSCGNVIVIESVDWTPTITVHVKEGPG